MKTEQVNHPSHYNKPGHKECIEEMREKFGDYMVATWCYITAYKYLYRMGLKENNSKEQDFAKAKWYITYAENHLTLYGGDMLIDDVKNQTLELFKEVENE